MTDRFSEFRSPEAIALTADICTRALDARDPRFDGLFFVGITSTKVYCRPVCPARVAYPSHRRFFDSAAAAEGAGFRPCLRCRPELAPGRAIIDAVSRLASAAARRIQAGALNGRSVAALARELGVSDRHLRRAVERELGVSPLALAQTHRLLLAKQLLADTRLSITRIAYASGFQSLRRFNAVFRDRYRLPPTVVRRTVGSKAQSESADDEPIRLTLAYRAPFAWDALLATIARTALPGVERVQPGRYARTIRIDNHRGLVFVEDASQRERPSRVRDRRQAAQSHLAVHVSPSLLPALMPLLAQLRRLFDLDAEPTAIDAHLAQDGLARFVALRPGVRVPGAVDGFEIALAILIANCAPTQHDARRLARRVVWALGDPFVAGVRGLDRLAPDASRIADAGPDGLIAAGIPRPTAGTIARLARLVADGAIRLFPGGDVEATYRTLHESLGVDAETATKIVMRALSWPDAFPASDDLAQPPLGIGGEDALLRRAERWRPWRAYAAMHLLHEGSQPRAAQGLGTTTQSGAIEECEETAH